MPHSELNYVGLLPALEEPLDQALASLVNLLEHQPHWKPDNVSLKQLVLTGLDWPTAHWFEAAVSWLSQGFPIDRDIAEIVHRRRDDHGLPQAARHRAFTLVRRWEKQQAGTP